MSMRREMEMGRHIVQARAPYLLETSPLDLAKYRHLSSSSSSLYTHYVTGQKSFNPINQKEIYLWMFFFKSENEKKVRKFK